MDLQTGWLSPSGDFYPCEEFDHYGKAEELIHVYGYTLLPHMRRGWPDEYLRGRGWVHITRSFMTHEYMIFWDMPLTEVQKNFLRSYFESSIKSMLYSDWEEELRNESVI